MVDACREIRAFTEGMTFEQFAADPKTRKAVLADFNIIGEAAVHVPDTIKAAQPGIAWRQARDMRNIIVHVYFSVDAATVWNTIKSDLGTMEQQLSALLASTGESPQA
jgi:uncharacterized protein with HEPN domain